MRKLDAMQMQQITGGDWSWSQFGGGVLCGVALVTTPPIFGVIACSVLLAQTAS